MTIKTAIYVFFGAIMLFFIEGVAQSLEPGKRLAVRAVQSSSQKKFQVRTRIDTPVELAYYQHGGILQYVLRQLTAKEK